MSQSPFEASLPPGRSLSTARQVRLLMIGAGVVVAVMLVVALFDMLGRKPAPAAQTLPPGTFRPTPQQLSELNIQTVGMGADPGDIVATGTISVDEDHSTPIVLPFSGQVGDVFVQAGQHVVKGQPLLRIASSDFVDARNALFAAVAQRATAAAQLKMAQDNEKRQSAIYQTAGGALKDFRQSQGDLVSAQSTMRAADATLGAARDKLALLGKSPAEIGQLEAAGSATGIYSETVYRAPVSGVIATRSVAPGQYVTAGGGTPLMMIADLTHVWLVAQVDQTDASKVRLGDGVDVTTPAYPGRAFHAVVDNIGATLDPVTHRLPVRATVANPDEALKPDMFASFAIRRKGEGGAVLVPASAVIREGDDAHVWVVERNGLLRAQKVDVTDSAGGMDKIGTGLVPGQRVVTAGAIFVNEAGLGE